MSTYRLLALDLDGTAIVDGQLPTPAVATAVACATARGVQVVLATGRGFQSACKWAVALGLSTPLICYQGALVKEVVGARSTLLIESVPTEPLLEAMAFAEERGLELTLYGQEAIYLARMIHPQEFYDLWFGLPIRRAPTLAQAYRLLQTCEGQPIKGLFIGEPSENDRLLAELRRRFGGQLNVVRSHPLFVEILAPGASKGHALAFLARRFGISQAETIAVGDSGNDVSMVQWAGLGVAMGNATPEVLAVADWVAPSVQDDGVAAVIERFVLGNGRM